MNDLMETTDGRFVQVDEDAWWDTQGTSLVPTWVVDEYLRSHPAVGVAKRSNDDA